MRIYYYLITTLFFCMPLSLFSMQSPIKELIVQEITVVKEPICVTFRNKNQIVVASQKRIDTVDWRNNCLEHTLNSNGMFILNCLYNKKTQCIAAADNSEVILYDDKDKNIWQTTTKPNLSCTFTANDTLYVMGSGILQNSRDKTVVKIPGKQPNLYGNMLPDPKKPRIFYTERISLTESALNTIKIRDNNITFEKQILPIPSKINEDSNKPYPYAYWPTEKIVALYYIWGNYWNLYDIKNKKFIEENLECYNLAFHPKKPLLALITKEGFVFLRNIFDKTIVAQTSKPLTTVPQDSPLWEKTIDFSEDGDQLALVIVSDNTNQCFVLSNLNKATD